MSEHTQVQARRLIGAAIKAPSSHNTQPWKFRVEPRRITVQADFSRRCPVVDPDDHHLFASLGCAVENLVITARCVGLEPAVTFDESSNSIVIELERAPEVVHELAGAIDSRQCSRNRYDGSALASHEIRKLEEAARGAVIEFRLLTGAGMLEAVASYVAEGNTAQFADLAWRRELHQWLRFNRRSAASTGDGLYGPAMGNPDVPDWLGRLFLRFAFSAGKQNRKDFDHIRHSSAVAVFISERDDSRHWMEAGRSCERFALQAAALDLRTAFINQPVEVASLRREFSSYLGLRPGQRADLLVRVGRGPSMPRSFRRPIDDVMSTM